MEALGSPRIVGRMPATDVGRDPLQLAPRGNPKART